MIDPDIRWTLLNKEGQKKLSNIKQVISKMFPQHTIPHLDHWTSTEAEEDNIVYLTCQLTNKKKRRDIRYISFEYKVLSRSTDPKEYIGAVKCLDLS
jgi:hypothetical protein